MAGRGLVLFSFLFLVPDVVSGLGAPLPQNKAVVNGTTRVAFDCTSSTNWRYIIWNVLPVGGSAPNIISFGNNVEAPYQDTCNVSNTRGHTSTLTIKTVNESLAGTYTCNDAGVASASAQLIVYNSDPVCTSNVSSGPNLYQGQTVQMVCTVSYTANSSNVGVNMTWSFINGGSSSSVQSPSPVITTTGTLTTAVSTITPTVGYSSLFPVYQCKTLFTVTGNTATNAATNVPDSTNTSQPYNSPITVYYFNPSCSIKGAKDRDIILFGTTISCEADANPPPSYRWSNETNATLSSEKSVAIMNDGNYTCTASNAVSRCAVSIYLTAYTTTAPPTTATTTTITPPTTSSPPVMSPADKSPPSEGLSETNKIIIGVVVGVGGFILLVAIILIVCWCMKKNKSGAKYENGTAKPAAERPPPYDGHVGPQRPSRPDSVDYASVDRQYQNASQSPYASGSPAHPRIGDDGLNYAQIQLDNQPRSRQPLQVPQNNSNYVEIALA